jgi:putative chitinase
VLTNYTIDPDALRHVCPNLSPDRAKVIARGLGEAFQKYDINTSGRAAMAVAQFAHESDRFRTSEEYASGSAYEGRRDLGNTQSGDGKRFKGRGRIMVTGRTNYAAVHSAQDVDCVSSPTLLAKSPNSELASAWWWSSHGCNGFADRNDFIGLTRRINGGTNGLADRQSLYAKAVQVADRLKPREIEPLKGLQTDERAHAEELLKQRRIIHRNGGWGKADRTHTQAAKAEAEWLRERRQRIKDAAEGRVEGQEPGWRTKNRKRRYQILKALTT